MTQITFQIKDKAKAQALLDFLKILDFVEIIHPVTQPKETSPLDVEGINLNLPTDEILDFIAEGRKSYE